MTEIMAGKKAIWGIFKIDSLKKTVVFSIVTVILLCALVSSFIVNLIIDFQMSGKYAAEKEAVVESLSTSLKPILETDDILQLDPIVNSVLIFENIERISVLDSEGNVLISADKTTGMQDIEMENYGIFVSAEKLGSFEIGFLSEYIDTFSSQTTLILVLTLVAFLLLAGVALYLLLRYSVISPIEYITRTIRTINPDNLNPRLNIGSNNEIGAMAVSFNRMAENLEQSQTALREARDDLEIKVEERTRGEHRRAEQLRAINEVGRRISSILSSEELLPYVVESLRRTFNFYSVNIFISDPSQGQLTLQAGSGGYQKTVPSGFKINLNQGIIGLAAAAGQRSRESYIAGYS